MKLVLLADEERKAEFLSIPCGHDVEIIWLPGVPASGTVEADLLVDLYHGLSTERGNWIQQQRFSCVMVNCRLSDNGIPDRFIRVNAWPGFAGQTIMEAYQEDPVIRELAANLVKRIGRQVGWTDKAAGYSSQRIIAAIINEAFLAKQESVASEQDIDTAMKLGTGYPFGPFEWAARIGYRNLLEILENHAPVNEQPYVSILLKEKALAQ